MRRAQPPAGEAKLVTDPELACVRHLPSTAVIATLADLSLGAATRSRCKRGELLATTSLGIRLIPHQLLKPTGLSSQARCVFVDARTGISTCEIAAGGSTIAAGSARFFRSRPGDAPSLMPWEQDDADNLPPLSRADLSSSELRTLEWVVQAAARSRASKTSVVDELLAVNAIRVATDRVEATMVLRTELQNRAGALQGGACFGAAATAAGPVVGDFLLADGHFHYVRPVRGESVTLCANLVHRGQSSATVAVSVCGSEKPRIAATGVFTFLAHPAPHWEPR
jgi:acyl-coenzyme A thioesterase PaaI-like protein